LKQGMRRAGLVLAGLSATVSVAQAGEGGSSHIMPGAMSSLADLPPTAPTSVFKLMYLDYDAGATIRIPTAAGVATDLDVAANTTVMIALHTFEATVLGGAHYSVAAALPYSSLDISGNVELPSGGQVARANSVSGFGDMTLIPTMLAWKKDAWTFNALLPIYLPTGDYELGRLGNPGLNYWTVDPTVGFVYSTQKGLNAMLHAGYAFNGENDDTNYKSGAMLHFDGAVQQILPVGKGFLTLGVEAFYFTQITGDSGSGATLGDFKGETAGLGAIIGYIQPMGKQTLVLEAKILDEMHTKNRVEGEIMWLKAVFKF
jgi:hypothetical protein